MFFVFVFQCLLTDGAGRLHGRRSVQRLLLPVLVLLSAPVAAVVVVVMVGSVLTQTLTLTRPRRRGLGQAGPLQVVLPQPQLLSVLRRHGRGRAFDGTEVDDRLRGRQRKAERAVREEEEEDADCGGFTQTT